MNNKILTGLDKNYDRLNKVKWRISKACQKLYSLALTISIKGL